MPKTIQIRNLDDDVYAVLARRAAAQGISVPELLRAQATHLAARPSMAEWLERLPRNSNTSITDAEVQAALDEIRGPWPGAGG